MKCERCDQSFPSRFHFKVPGVCNDCFSNLPEAEQSDLLEAAGELNPEVSGPRADAAIGKSRGIGCGLIALAPLVYAVLFVGAFLPQSWASAEAAQSNASLGEASVLLAPFLTVLMMIGGSGPLVLAPLGAVFGLILLVSGRKPGVFGWLGLACLAVPVIALGIILGLGVLNAEDWPSALASFSIWLLVPFVPMALLAWRIKTVCASINQQESQ